jgi:hypothetical protein
MNASSHDPLDREIAKLPREVEPRRDLWPDIRAQIEAQPAPVKSAPISRMRWYQLAAAVLLIVGSSFTTFVVMREQPVQAPTMASEEVIKPALNTMPASFAGQGLGQGYAQARAALDEQFAARLEALPPAARQKVERNLADIRKAAHEIADTLAQHPNDPLLQDLLLSTYQSELRLLADVTQMSPAPATRVDL